MQWNQHFGIKDAHAFLSGSKFAWLNYDDQKLIDSFISSEAAKRGSEVHAFAAREILALEKYGEEFGLKLVKKRKTLPMYINDAVQYKMRPEQLLYYTENCFGTADTISFDDTEGLLRIHDLKTGVIPAHMEQLEIYAGLFCLEYRIPPDEIKIELRIYQNDQVITEKPNAETQIIPIINHIIHGNEVIENYLAARDGRGDYIGIS